MEIALQHAVLPNCPLQCGREDPTDASFLNHASRARLSSAAAMKIQAGHT